MGVQYPYRAVICGEKYIIEGWRGRKLVTNKGNFSVRHIYTDWQIQDQRLLEVAAIQADEKGGWQINGLPLSLLESLPFSERFADIPRDEDLRVYEDEILAVAWFDKTGFATQPTELLDLVLKFWETASLPIEKQKTEETLANVFRAVNVTMKHQRIFAPVWSEPVYLTEFRRTGKGIFEKNKKNNLLPMPADEIKAEKSQKSAEIKNNSPEIPLVPKNNAKFEPDYFFSYKDAAEYIGRTARTITNWKRDGWLKVEKMGKKVRIARTDLDKCKNRE